MFQVDLLKSVVPFCNMQFQFPKRILLNRAPTSTSQFADGYKVPSEKTLSHLKGQFPPKTTLLKSQQNFQTRLRSNFLFTSILNIHLKSFQDYWSQVNSRQTFTDRIYWHQSTNSFIDSHLFMYSQKGGLTIDLMIKPPLYECINKLQDFI